MFGFEAVYLAAIYAAASGEAAKVRPPQPINPPPAPPLRPMTCAGCGAAFTLGALSCTYCLKERP